MLTLRRFHLVYGSNPVIFRLSLSVHGLCQLHAIFICLFISPIKLGFYTKRSLESCKVHVLTTTLQLASLHSKSGNHL